MVAQHNDRRGVPARDLGNGRNTSSKKRAAKSISAQLARQCLEEPSSGTHNLMGQAGDNMASLKPRMKALRAFLTETSEKKSRGELDGEAYSAEVAPANVVFALHSALEILLQRASEKGDKASLQAVSWASGTLAAHLDTEMTKITAKQRYPDVPALRADKVGTRKQKARDLYTTVLENPDVQTAIKKLDVGVVDVSFLV